MRQKRRVFIVILTLILNTINAQTSSKSIDSTVYKKAQKYRRLMVHFSQKRDHVTERKYIDSLYAFSKKHQLKEFEMLGLMNVGIIYKEKGELQKALKTYLEVIEQLEKLPNTATNQRIKIMTLQNMANVYSTIGSEEKAIEIFERALSLAEKQKDNAFVLGAILSNIAASYSKLNQIDESIAYQKRVLELAKKKKNTYLIVYSLSSLSERYRKKGDFTKALEYANEAQQLNVNTKTNKHNEGSIFLRKGLAYEELKQLDSAKYYLLEARKSAIINKKNRLEIAAEEELSKLYEKLGDFENAQKSQKRFNELNTKNLKEYTKTAVLSTKKEAEAKLKNIKENSRINIVLIAVFSLIAIALLSGFLIQKNRLKKRTELENKQLQTDFKWIKDQYASLKESMLKLSEEKELVKNTKKYKNSSLSELDRMQYMNRILEFMDAKKPHLNAELTHAGLANDLKINAHHLSEVLALSFGQNFNNFINIYRVNNAQELLKNPDYANYKVEAIGYESGFNSKASFNRVFKNTTGLTPTEFQKKEQSKTSI